MYYNTLTNFSTEYLMVCKIYTDVGGVNSYTKFVHLYVLNLVDYLHVPADNPWFIYYMSVSAYLFIFLDWSVRKRLDNHLSLLILKTGFSIALMMDSYNLCQNTDLILNRSSPTGFMSFAVAGILQVNRIKNGKECGAYEP